MTVGERLKEIRQLLRLSQGELGNKVGLKSQAISNIEKDKSFFSLEKLQKLSELNVNLNYLISGIGQPLNAAQNLSQNVNNMPDSSMRDIVNEEFSKFLKSVDTRKMISNEIRELLKDIKIS